MTVVKTVFKSEEGKTKILKYYDKILSKWDVPYNERFIDTTFGRTHILEAGEKSNPPVFLFHGSSTNALMWTGDIKALRKKHQIFAVDILGEPGKSDETRLNLSTDENSLWINELLDQPGVDKAVFMGNSLGGWMALDFAIRNPKKVSKLILIASSGIMPVKKSFIFKSIFLSIMGEKGMEKLGKQIYGSEKLPKEVMDFSNLVAKHFKPRMGALPLFDEAALKKLSMPVLYIGGENDITVDTQKSAEKIDAAAPDAKSLLIPNNGHVVFNIMEKIIPFLETR